MLLKKDDGNYVSLDLFSNMKTDLGGGGWRILVFFSDGTSGVPAGMGSYTAQVDAEAAMVRLAGVLGILDHTPLV